MIKTLADKRTAALLSRNAIKGIPSDAAQRARRKLAMIDQASGIEDLRIPPSNHLETLKGNRSGQHSIRVNDQWRICFVWHEGDAYDVEFCDYH